MSIKFNFIHFGLNVRVTN